MSECPIFESQPNPIKIGIVEDDPSTRYFLVKIIERETSVDLAGCWPNAESCLKEAQFENLDALLVDLQLPGMDGIELIRKVKRKAPRISCIILTASHSSEDIHAALKLGASGYITKDSSPSELVFALTNIATGGVSLSRRVAGKLIDDYFLNKSGDQAGKKFVNNLTEREKQILTKLSAGIHSKDIALEMELSYETIRAHLKRAYQKMNVNSQQEALRKFKELDK